MNALIIAAGRGNRLKEMTADRPKALVSVGGRELILHVLDFLRRPLINRCTVVTGYHAERLERFLRQHAPSVDIISNPFYEQGSIRTLEAALPAMTDEFLLMNVDHLYPHSFLDLIFEKRRGLMAVCDFDRTLGPDDMKVKLNGTMTLKAIRKTLTDYDGGYIGMTFCDRLALPLYRQAIIETRQRFGDQAPAEWVLGLLADQGMPINICDVSNHRWLEIDTLEDLSRAEETLRAQKAFLS